MTTLTKKADITRFTVVALRGHLRLMALGMRNSAITKTEMLAKATAVTGKPYKRGQFDDAIADINKWLEEHK